jgi:hypothetical protein
VVKCVEVCYAQETPINKDAKRLSINKSSFGNTANLWFGLKLIDYEAKNFLEVPWVDAKLREF